MGFLPKILIIWAFAFNPQLVLQPLPRAPTAAPLTFTVSSVGPCVPWGRGRAPGSVWAHGEGSAGYWGDPGWVCWCSWGLSPSCFALSPPNSSQYPSRDGACLH